MQGDDFLCQDRDRQNDASQLRDERIALRGLPGGGTVSEGEGMTISYSEFLKAKVAMADDRGITIADDEISSVLKPHQKAIVKWAVRGGRRAIFAAFGLGKTLIQLEIVRLILKHAGGRGLIVCPLGVRQEFVRDAKLLGLEPKFIRRIEEAEETGIYLTNYETVRDQKMDPRGFTVISLDEAACLRGFGGSKTFREFMRVYEGTTSYRFVATATPDPNQYIELLAYSCFLDVMDVGQAKTRWFKRDSTKADNLTLHPHKADEFWLWVSSWALFAQRPSDLGFSDEGYELPSMSINWHCIPSDHSDAGTNKRSRGRLFRSSAYGVTEAAKEKRESIPARIAKLMELRELDIEAHRVIWHDLESERNAIEKEIPSAVSIFGSQNLDEREKAIIGFSEGEIAELAAKPVLAGSGTNFQRHCAWEIFMGIGFKFNDFIQAIHRCHRFLQEKQVRIDIIYTEAEESIRKVLEGKWKRYDEQAAKMSELIKKHGLANIDHGDTIKRSVFANRKEVTGPGYRIVCNDAVQEMPSVASDSVGLIVTSIPFSTQYEYTPTYNDFGHTDNNGHFWQQMDFLTPELFRALMPGRICCIHVKDRITPSGITGLGFQVVQPFHAEAIYHYTKHGFGYMGMKTIVTDVVRENNQTYRLGWTEQCKDGTKMGCGMPEYLLIFRKPPTDRSNGYADVPVVKDKSDYQLCRWQIDANSFQRSNGDRPLTAEEMKTLAHSDLFKRWRDFNTKHVYDYEKHVALGAAMQEEERLPVTFNLLPPHSPDHPDVWTDVARMRTLNMLQERKGAQAHLCPLQFDIVNRCIVQYTMKGETVLDPFGGLMTVPYCALKLGRETIGIELSEDYWRDGVGYVMAAIQQEAVPSLFDLMDEAIS